MFYYENFDRQLPTIIRSSYNFCVNFTKCKNFYNKNEPPTCKSHHYVHSLVKYDTDSVINFLQYVCHNKPNLTIESVDNLHSSAKTMYYVIKHMQKELNHVKIFTTEYEFFHRNNLSATNSSKSKRRFASEPIFKAGPKASNKKSVAKPTHRAKTNSVPILETINPFAVLKDTMS